MISTRDFEGPCLSDRIRRAEQSLALAEAPARFLAQMPEELAALDPGAVLAFAREAARTVVVAQRQVVLLEDKLARLLQTGGEVVGDVARLRRDVQRLEAENAALRRELGEGGDE